MIVLSGLARLRIRRSLCIRRQNHTSSDEEKDLAQSEHRDWDFAIKEIVHLKRQLTLAYHYSSKIRKLDARV